MGDVALPSFRRVLRRFAQVKILVTGAGIIGSI
jgi:hypothetical protein